ncbi:MAG TPA: YbhN family protein [Solirubrobacterales bacterium]|nr:YbhN family protein [Solirubrobacterales bacterium]
MSADYEVATSVGGMEELPREFQTKSLRRRTLQALIAGTVLTAIVLFAPGLGEVRDRLADAAPGWLALAAVLEGLSFASYVVMFGPVFCAGLGWRRAWEIGGSELAMGSLVPASGAGGLALGAWVLYRGGMDGGRIARRSVAFFLIKSGVNFVAVALIGTALAVGLVGPDLSLWLTAFPAVMATLAIGAVASLPRLGSGPRPFPGPDASRARRWLSATRRAVVRGVTEARGIVRAADRRVLAGSFGYWFFDNAVLWATFHSFGMSPPITVILMGYLIGQLGGLLPVPGGIGGIDLGLIGVLVAYGTPVAGTTAAVFAYHVILFWLPLIVGGIAFTMLRRNMPGRSEFASCAPAIAAQSTG